MNKCATIIGFHGRYNIGDDLMLEVHSIFLKKYYDIDIIYVWAKQNNIKHLDNKNGARIKGIINDSKILNRFNIYINKLIKVFFLLKSDLLLIGGGSIIHKNFSSKWKYRYVKLYKKLRKNTVTGALGVSIGPFESSDDFRWAEILLQELDFLVVRDQKSYDLTRRMSLPYEVVLGFDLAVLHPASNINNDVYANDNSLDFNNQMKTNYSKKIIGFSLMMYDKFKGQGLEFDNSRLREFKSTIEMLLNADSQLKIRLFCLSSMKERGDEEITLNLLKSLTPDFRNRVEYIQYNFDTDYIIKLIDQCDIMVSMRLHGSIISYMKNTPLILIDYHNKCLEFSKLINLDEEYIFDRNSIKGTDMYVAITKLLQSNQVNWTLNLNEAKISSELNYKYLLNID